MTIKDWITAILALYGAALSSYLAYREIMKERRQIKMTLQYVEFREIAQLIIVNSGHRPITITEIAAAVSRKDSDGKEYPEGVPSNALFNTVTPEIPKLLNDGQTVIYELGPVLSGLVMESFIKDVKVFISLFDAEGNVYHKYERRLGNAKWGGSFKKGK
jgi:hypothetical protein